MFAAIVTKFEASADAVLAVARHTLVMVGACPAILEQCIECIYLTTVCLRALLLELREGLIIDIVYALSILINPSELPSQQANIASCSLCDIVV